MTIKRLILSILTIVAISFIGFSLFSSVTQPQIQSRLELYQTNLLLHAAEWQPEDLDSKNFAVASEALIGNDSYEAGLIQYKNARQSAQQQLEKQTLEVENLGEVKQLYKNINQLKSLINEFDINIGILQAQKNKIDDARQSWQNLTKSEIENLSLGETAKVLSEIWNKPARILPDAESLIQKNLDGWFRYRALKKLYKLQERQEVLSQLEIQEQEIAQQAVFKLAIVAGLPGMGLVFGIGLLIFLGVQLLISGKESLFLKNANLPWEVTWDGETILQVFVVGFFLVGQILIPLGLEIFKGFTNWQPAMMGVRVQAGYILGSYILFSIGGLLVLYFSLKSFFPLPKDWFKFDLRGGWFFWGLGGYFVALPMVILISLINQQLWQGQGGSNPILPIALKGQDGLALALFYVTASIAAPVFEEIMFRGFLLPSLTKYMSVWGAIVASGFLFAVAHLNISEVLPLAVLGMILGVVYTRSRNLLSSMLLHSLWNSGTLLSLYILGSGAG
ncbi:MULTISPECIES: CPBP family intramembrane glutamic endopeptidase [Okeania]|uniref:CPBP family intramembrane metalloprotease n=1 Tax=Okeania hirsuta TaxID=1458930 RepID=A0A3N6PK14_9CYAN|nr:MULTISPECIES: type II CAAX endopeptidase family protein [Okeania]NET13668.1 CPBP family intramembrane metalloprotease [Okeania sp. SIO1H6]NES74477.1 CPBP family intramembrane metalloprotease [Okeania sp. SIO1H4]NES90256.1 CPBP family intramembrane metalloprotease [Okeania sp. SIO2B9]NET18038.1 CPBP family intramembrane metalloprotease [Okeania sp. SIO1H5]NET76350.1 CPBP family intramembrane metalloprotease [Okeania sp. SIO1F9]